MDVRIVEARPDHAGFLAWVTLTAFRSHLQRGRTRGAAVSDISVFIGNDPAQRAYEKTGFEVIGEKRHPDFEAAYKTPGVRTLRRPLHGADSK